MAVKSSRRSFVLTHSDILSCLSFLLRWVPLYLQCWTDAQTQIISLRISWNDGVYMNSYRKWLTDCWWCTEATCWNSDSRSSQMNQTFEPSLQHTTIVTPCHLHQGSHHNGNRTARRPHALCSVCVHSLGVLAKTVRLFRASLHIQPMRLVSIELCWHFSSISNRLAIMWKKTFWPPPLPRFEA